MTDKLTISLIAKYDEHFPVVKEYLEKQGHNIRVIKENKLSDNEIPDLSIVFINDITFDIIVFVENNFKNQAVILNYNYCPDEISIELFSKYITFHNKHDLNTLPILIENAIIKNQLLQENVEKSELESPLLFLIEKILSVNVNIMPVEEYINNVLTMVSEFAGADEIQFFLLPKFKNFNVILYKNIVEKHNINKISEFYPDIECDSLIENLKKNQELIISKKNGNVKTDITVEKAEKHYYSLIVLPIFINNTLYGCLLLNFQKAIKNINKLRQKLLYISKFISLQFQYKIVYNQYENSINQFRRLINDAINGIYQSTVDGKIIYANPAFLKIVGYDSLEKLKEINLFTDLYASISDREKFIKKIKKEKAVHNYESVLKKKNREIINVLENSRIIENQDGTVLFEGIIQDITNQINLKEKLKSQTSFSEKIIEDAPFLIFAIDENNEVILWNSMAEIITGYDRNKIYNDSKLLNKLITSIDSFEDHVSAIIRTKGLVDDSKYIDVEMHARDGSKKIIRWSWTVNDYLSDDTKLILGFGLDVTETKKLEEQLFESQKMESIGTLAAGMAYDFNNILNELNVYNSSLKSLIEKDSKKTAYVNKIEDTIKKASIFTSKLIGLSRKDKKKYLKFDVNNCINYVIDLLEHTVHDGIVLEKDICNEPLIEGDISQIHQAILNIAINSKESISNKGKINFKTEIVIAKSDDFLHTINPPVTNYVKITVSDSGKGIPTELHQRVFDPLFTTKTSGKSAGLGLSVAYNIVKNHRGYIFVESTLEKGTNFFIYVPYIGEPSNSYIGKESDVGTEMKKRELKENFQILVVDDEAIIRDLLNDVLIDQNYDVILAKDGFEGLELYKKNKKSIDLIILDIIMPGMSGKEVFDKIREIDKEAKIIITSGYSKQKVTESLMSSGANGFLPKPFNIDKLLGLIKALVEEK
jgi:PAS domain S-box-containing protein